MAFTREELLAEAKRRNLDVSQYENTQPQPQVQAQPQFSREELLAEAQRRKLKIPIEKGAPRENPGLLNTLGNEVIGGLQGINDVASGFRQGLARPVAGLHNLISRGLNSAFGTNEQMLNPEFDKAATNKNLAFAGELGSAFALPSLGIAKAAQALPLAAKSAPEISNALKIILCIGTEAGTYGALAGAANPNSDILKDFLTGGALGAGLGGIGAAIQTPAAMASKYVRNLASKASPGGIKSPEEAAAAYEAIKPVIGDAKIDLGSLIGDMPLSRKYNEKLRNSFGAGGTIADNQQNLIGAANKETNTLLSNLLGNTSDRNAHQSLIDKIQGIKDTNTQQARDMFNSLMQEATERGYSLPGWNKAAQYAREVLGEEGKVLASGIKGELRSVLENLAKPVNQGNGNKYIQNSEKPAGGILPADIGKKPQGYNGQQPNYSYQDAHFSHSNMGKLGDELAAKQEYRAANVANNLQKRIREDIEDSLKSSGNEDLFNRWVEARRHFEANVVPFRKKSLSNILAGDKNADKIASELLLDKNKDILPHLDQETKNLLGYTQFADLMKDVGYNQPVTSLQKMLNRFQKLDRGGDLGILTPEAQQQFKSLATLNNMLPEAKLATNPAGTGIRSLGKLENLIKLGTIGGGYMLHPSAAILAALYGPAKNNLQSKALTSDWLRNAYIKQGVKGPEVTPLTLALSRMFATQTGGNK